MKHNAFFRQARFIAQILIILFGLYWSISAVKQYNDYTNRLWNPEILNKDAASEWEKRLLGIRDDLPKKGVIGYLSEQDYPGISFSPTDSDEEFALTQYFLSPRILDRGSKRHKFIIGNFAGDFEYNFERDLGLRMVTNYGYGIYLLEGRDD